MLSLFFKHGIVVAALTLLIPPAGAQELPQGRLEGDPGAGRPRVGGILRERLAPQEGKEREGLEEGIPRLRIKPDEQGLIPEFFPPARMRWRLGVFAYNTDTGVVVTRVIPGSAASRLGLERGDRLVTINGFQIGWVENRLYPLASELQLQADRRGNVTLLIQNVRNDRLLNRRVQLDRWR